MSNLLYYGDNLAVLRESVKDESADLIYLDPPFNSSANYNVLFKAPSGEGSQAQIEAFEDTWHWNESAERAFDEVVTGPHSDASIMLKAMRAALGENDMMAYLAMMAVRLIELHRVLKPAGSLYLHCDPTASHYLKMLLDGIFGPRNFRSEIVWKRSSAHSDTKQGRKLHGHIHDVIFFYTKGSKWTWNEVYTPYGEEYLDRDYGLVDEAGRHFRRGDLTAAKPGGDTEYEWRVKKHQGAKERWVADLDDEHLKPQPGWEYRGVPPYGGRFWAYSKDNMRQFAKDGRLRHTFDGMPEYKRFLDEMPGVPLQDLWTDITPIIAGQQERLGYPTQKPLSLLERIIESSSNKNDVVLDPFCGCGTTIHAARKLDRQWIGIDITHLAIGLIERRLKDAFPGIKYEVHGVPTDLAGATNLAERDKHEFQKWITAKVGAQPYKGGKKGMDRGIDGYLHFRDADKKPQFAIVSVKGGGTNSGHVRDLKGTMDREKAALGLFLTLNKPTREMEKEAAAAGLYETGGIKVPRLQILTAEDIIDDRRPQVPYGFTEGFKKAAREEKGQERLL